MSYRGNQFNQFKAPAAAPALGPVALSRSSLEHFERVLKAVEDAIDEHSRPLKPYVPAIGRAFIVATFYEDLLRIVSQWLEQVYYLYNYRHVWRWLTVLFLFANVVTMVVASTLMVLRKKPEAATLALVLIVLLQGFFYGLITDAQFILRNLLVVGGLILAFLDLLVRDKRLLLMPGLPMLNNTDNKKYFLLAGRLLLVFLFMGFVFSALWLFWRVVVILIGFVLCGSIIVGYKTKFAAFVLTVLLFAYNVFANQFWAYSAHDSNRDFLKYEFFQTLLIVGGLLIIVNAGAGELSLDEKKKIY